MMRKFKENLRYTYYKGKPPRSRSGTRLMAKARSVYIVTIDLDASVGQSVLDMSYPPPHEGT